MASREAADSRQGTGGRRDREAVSCRVLSFRKQLDNTSFQVRGRSATSLIDVLHNLKDLGEDSKDNNNLEICGLARFVQAVRALNSAKAGQKEVVAKQALEAFGQARALDPSSRVLRKFANLPDVAPELWKRLASENGAQEDGKMLTPSAMSVSAVRRQNRYAEVVRASLRFRGVVEKLHSGILDAIARQREASTAFSKLVPKAMASSASSTSSSVANTSLTRPRSTSKSGARSPRPQLLAIWGSAALEVLLTAEVIQASDALLMIEARDEDMQTLVERVVKLQATGPQAGSLRKPLFLESSALRDFIKTSRLRDTYDITLVAAAQVGGGLFSHEEAAVKADLTDCIAFADQLIVVDLCAPEPLQPTGSDLAICRTIDAAEVVLRCRTSSDQYKGKEDDPVIVWAAHKLGLDMSTMKSTSTSNQSKAGEDTRDDEEAGGNLILSRWQELLQEAGFQTPALVAEPTQPLYAFILSASASPAAK